MTTTTELPPVPSSPKESRVHPFQVLLTPTEQATLTALAKTYGISKGAFCRFGLHGLMEKAKRDLESHSPQGLPVTVDSFWHNFRKNER